MVSEVLRDETTRERLRHDLQSCRAAPPAVTPARAAAAAASRIAVATSSSGRRAGSSRSSFTGSSTRTRSGLFTLGDLACPVSQHLEHAPAFGPSAAATASFHLLSRHIRVERRAWLTEPWLEASVE